jgi:hemoglobin-like flavoprotein
VLMTMLGTVVAGLSHMESLLPVAASLAKRHVGYGVIPEHYAFVGTALLDTLSKGLGPAFTPEVNEAWTTAYGTLSKAMIGAARGS